MVIFVLVANFMRFYWNSSFLLRSQPIDLWNIFRLRFQPTGNIRFPDSFVRPVTEDLATIPVGSVLYQVCRLLAQYLQTTHYIYSNIPILFSQCSIITNFHFQNILYSRPCVNSSSFTRCMPLTLTLTFSRCMPLTHLSNWGEKKRELPTW